MMTKFLHHLLLINFLFLSSLVLPRSRVHGNGSVSVSRSKRSCLETEHETDNEREFSYGKGGKGPDAWGKIHPDWGVCSSGGMQSPIDLSDSRVVIMRNLGMLKRNYKNCSASVKNRGHDIMVQWNGDAGGINIDGIKYSLKQCHWHAPAEHTFNGTRETLELHIVHQTDDGKIAVIGVTYKHGKPDSFLDKIIPHITHAKAAAKDIGPVNPMDINVDDKKYYRYVGSLTVPPCTEGVIWTIVKKVSTVSEEQVAALREAVHDHSETNARPIQEQKAREVILNDL